MHPSMTWTHGLNPAFIAHWYLLGRMQGQVPLASDATLGNEQCFASYQLPIWDLPHYQHIPLL